MRTIAGVTAALALAGVVHAESVDTMAQALNGTDDARAEAAARQLGASSEPKAVEPMLKALATGVSPRVGAALLDGVGQKRDPRTFDVFRAYANNRNATLRSRAVYWIGQQAGKGTQELLAALSDSDPQVRKMAAEALARRKERTAEPMLWKLLERKDQAAGLALAQLATPDTAHKLSEMSGQIPDGLLCDTIGAVLKRSDFGPDPLRLQLVNTLAKIPGTDSYTTLLEYVASTAKEKDRLSRREAEKIVKQREANP